MSAMFEPSAPARRPWDPQLQSLRREVNHLHDTLAVQARVGGVEAQAMFLDLERRWMQTNDKLARLEANTEGPAARLREDAVMSLEDLRRRYWALRDRILASTS